MERRAKIVATIGPSCQDEATLEKLIRAGMNVARLNFSHGTHAEHAERIATIRRIAEKLGVAVGILQDLQGPKIRTGELMGKQLFLEDGQRIRITTRKVLGNKKMISIPYAALPRLLKKGNLVLIDDGLIELRVLKIEKGIVACRVVAGGLLGEHKGVNIPYVKIRGASLTLKDKRDLAFGIRHGVDFVAISFVCDPNDIRKLKKRIPKSSPIGVIAKIEKPRAVNRIQQILEHTDAVMIARGDLGIEMGVEKIPAIQKRLIKFANDRKVPIITATQMLESMMHCPRPTRAEASDVANAVFDGTDAVMLSGETAIGKYPVEAVRTMSRIILEAESHVKESPENGQQATKGSELDAIVRAAKDAAHYLKAEAIVVFTVSGKTAVHISKLGSDLPIIVLTPSKEVQARLALLRGVKAFQISSRGTMDITLKEGDEFMIRNGLLKHQDTVIVVTGKRAFPEAKFMVKVHKVSS